MSKRTIDPVAPPGDREHILGRISGASGGPTVLVLAGIHGNEPAGVEASRRVFDRLGELTGRLRGEVVFLVGNLGAMREGVRFVEFDLNRRWTSEVVRGLQGSAAPAAEDAEQLQLLAVLGRIIAGARGDLNFLDLHTSSAAGAPFVTVGDTLRNRRFARRIPLPLILGLEEQVDGALLEYLNNRGVVTMGVEGGHHQAPESADRLESVVWMALAAAGAIDEASIPDGPAHRARLAAACRNVPAVVEVRRRHAISERDGFRMEPGFTNFQRVQAGQPVARDMRGAIFAPEDGLLLLPLYQGQGDDGFFIAREVRLFWLRASALLRRLRLYNVIPLLPGVRRHSEDPEVLLVDTRIARWYPLEIFHLFGFRKLREVGRELVVSRRRYDLDPPRRISLTGEA